MSGLHIDPPQVTLPWVTFYQHLHLGCSHSLGSIRLLCQGDNVVFFAASCGFPDPKRRGMCVCGVGDTDH